MATRWMATAALLLLAASALAVEGQTKSFPVMYKDFMEGKSGMAKVASYGYEESELQGACLRMITRQNCIDTPPGGGLAYNEYWETDVGCCAEGYRKHQDVFRLPEDLKVGSCWWTAAITGGNLVGVTPSLIGAYEVTCEMKQDSEKCGEPLCDDLVLKGWGRVFYDTNVAIQGKPSITAECEVSDRRLQSLLKAEAPAPKTNPAKIASAASYYKEEEAPEYFPGAAVIYDGYVQVISCSKKVAYKEGKMQAVGFYNIDSVNGGGDAPAIKPSPDQFIAKPFTMDFILRKTGDY